MPTLPGNIINPETELLLKRHVAALCEVDNLRFPGSQPVSFDSGSLERLEKEDYWVCEKSDGIRVLVLIVINPGDGGQEVYLIDRKNNYRQLTGLFFPHFENPKHPLTDTLLDGELVVDVDPRTKVETPRLLLFDCIIGDRLNLIARPLVKRYGRLLEWVFKPYDKMIKEFPRMADNRPFDIKVKSMQPSYHVARVINEEVPRLQHPHDGLIFTCAESPYVTGTDHRILKWKPPSENSVDLKLELRFPPLLRDPSRPDMTRKPAFVLSVWQGGDKYAFFDLLDIPDNQWEKMKESREQWDERIVELSWDASKESWNIMRFRDDKPNANHASVVESVLESIRDGVEVDALIAHSDRIRTEWRAREQRRLAETPAAPRPTVTQSQGGQRDDIARMRARLYGPRLVDGFMRI